MFSPALPNDFRERTSPGFGRFVNDSPGGIMRAPPVLNNGLGVLCQSLGSGIVLVGSPSLASPSHCETKTSIAPLTQVPEVAWGIIPFVAVPNGL